MRWIGRRAWRPNCTNCPLENYGYRGYLLSPRHGLKKGEGGYFITGPSYLGLGYNCAEVNEILVERLRRAGKMACLRRGKDAAGLFWHHYFALTQEGEIYDAVGLYPFKGAGHTFRRGDRVEIGQAQERNVTNPAAVLDDPLTRGRYLSRLEFVWQGEENGTEKLCVSLVLAEVQNPKSSLHLHLFCGAETSRRLAPPDSRAYLDQALA